MSVALWGLIAAMTVMAGCGGVETPERRRVPAGELRAERGPEPEVRRAACPPGATNCASRTGTIVYIERVDPDGDGDAHFVILDEQGITTAGITVIDVAAELRPRPLPGIGVTVSAAGPVYEGSYGQRQIEADVLEVPKG